MNEAYKKILNRLIATVASIFGIIIITFIISRALPGDPVWLRLSPKATTMDYIREKKRLGLDQPIFVQFIVYMQDLFTGNWGFSLVVQKDYPIWDLIATYLPRTLDVVFLSMFFAIILGIWFGKISASHKNSIRDKVIRIIGYFIISAPAFIIVLFLMQIIVHTPFKFIPVYGMKNPAYPDPPQISPSRLLDCILSGNFYLLIDYLQHLIIPVSGMALIQMVTIIRHTRVSILEVMQMDFVRTAQAKGLKQKTIINKHVMKNALPPVVTVSAMGFPIVLGGMIAVEYIYNYPGLGFLFRAAALSSDYPLIIGVIFSFSICAILMNLLADIINIFLDPRIRLN
jgi:peptide/nickel transport system permease protein